MIATETPVHESFADLHRRLGGIPLDRIRLRPAPGTATEDDLLRAGKPVCELIDGVLVEKAVGNRESLLGLYVGHLLWTHIEAEDLGVVTGEAGHVRVSSGLRAPDLSFFPWSSFADGESPDSEGYWSATPAFVVEVLSPGNTRAEIDRKLAELFAAGCRLAWVIDPRAQAAKVYTSPKKFKELDATGTLDGGKVLPGFKLPLAELFAATRRRKKTR
ncbi:MAG: Uma2 family endonuclease [Gemmataceae bacterium]|nr:Uma2 family endonuclease [Gemmataceae bacterium]